MSTSLLLQDKTVVIYGAGGAIGHAVARTFAREGHASSHRAPGGCVYVELRRR